MQPLERTRPPELSSLFIAPDLYLVNPRPMRSQHQRNWRLENQVSIISSPSKLQGNWICLEVVVVEVNNPAVPVGAPVESKISNFSTAGGLKLA